MQNVTLKKSYLKIGELEKVIYNFSDNEMYLISIDVKDEAMAEERIEKYFSKKSNELKFSDIAEFIPKK